MSERARRRPRLFAVVGLAASAALAVGATDAAEQTLRRAFERFQEAFLAADTATLALLLTEDYVHTNGGSPPIGRDAWLRWVESRRGRVDAGALAYDEYEVEDLRTSVSGDSAIVTGRVRAKGRDEGRPFAVDVRFTQLWTRREGTWKRAAFQDAPVPAADPADG